MNKLYLTAIVVSVASVSQAQTFQLQDLEAVFLQKNYLLIANKFNIDKADAEIVQEKLWDNPTLSINEFNLWSNPNSEEMAPLFGNYGRTQQFGVELEQLVETAGKRKKRVAIKSLEKNAALFDYEELMRDLKKDLRQTFNSLSRIKQEEQQVLEIVRLFEQLHKLYANQAEKQNISKADYYRVQTELIGLQKEHIELENEKMEALHKLRVLTQIKDLDMDQLIFSPARLNLTVGLPADLTDLAVEQNIGIKRQDNALQIADKQLLLEKAQRKPDLTFQVNYDRGGNIMQDFVGLGVSMDLPILNTNKGNIKVAKYRIEQEKYNRSAMILELENTVIRLRSQLQKFETSLSQWSLQNTAEQAQILSNYRKNLQNNQVTLIEFIDFTQAFREAQTAYLDLMEDYNNTYEELQYVIGKDF